MELFFILLFCCLTSGLLHMLIFQEFRAKMQPSNSTNRMNMVRSSSYTSLESASEQQPTSSLRRQQSAPNSQNTTPLKSINNSASNSPLRATADSRVRTRTDCWYSRTCLERQLLYLHLCYNLYVL